MQEKRGAAAAVYVYSRQKAGVSQLSRGPSGAGDAAEGLPCAATSAIFSPRARVLRGPCAPVARAACVSQRRG